MNLNLRRLTKILSILILTCLISCSEQNQPNENLPSEKDIKTFEVDRTYAEEKLSRSKLSKLRAA